MKELLQKQQFERLNAMPRISISISIIIISFQATPAHAVCDAAANAWPMDRVYNLKGGLTTVGTLST
jgi:hypothetical protein